MDYKNMTEESAKQAFQSGIDCSMAVAAHCSHKVGISEEQALRMAAALR
ncbi:MAG: hypothetical protein VB031_07105 [Eubacteriaceae bacterium]|nr:hypothetical protein [Eubacteriaceae bacterium]